MTTTTKIQWTPLVATGVGPNGQPMMCSQLCTQVAKHTIIRTWHSGFTHLQYIQAHNIIRALVANGLKRDCIIMKVERQCLFCLQQPNFQKHCACWGMGRLSMHNIGSLNTGCIKEWITSSQYALNEDKTIVSYEHIGKITTDNDSLKSGNWSKFQVIMSKEIEL